VSPTRRVLITGASGAVGPAVVAAFAAGGAEVRAYTRRGFDPPRSAGNVGVMTGEITDTASLRAVMASCDTVIHLASLLHITNPSPELESEFHRVNVAGTAAVLETAIEMGVRRVVQASTIAVYGPSGGTEFDELSPPMPDSPYARTKLEAERLALSATRRDGRPLATVLRFAAVYGPRMKANYERLVRAIAAGRFVGLGRGRNRRTLVHERDAAAAIVVAADNVRAAGRIYNVSDGEFHSLRAIVDAIQSATGRHRVLWLPEGPFRLAVPVVDGLAHLAGSRFRLRQAIEKLTEDVAVRAVRIQDELGFRPGVAFEDGWRDAVSGILAGSDRGSAPR
jgi:nucleoside-diphosphate-sugar epimerase